MQNITPLGLEPSENDKYAILLTFFGLNRDQATTRWRDFNHFFENYSSEIRQLCFGVTGSSSWIINQLAVQTHQDILHVCKVLASNKSVGRSKVREELRHHFGSSTIGDKPIDRSIDLTVRLWLMVNVRDPELPIYDPQKSSVQWPDSDSLLEFMRKQFPATDTELSLKEARLHTSFTAAYLVDVCGLQLDWTDNLQDHLFLDRRSKTLRVFAHQPILAGYRDSGAYAVNWYESTIHP